MDRAAGKEGTAMADPVATPPAGAKRARKAKAEGRLPSGREAIMESALRLFGERGFEEVKTSEILEAAGQRNQTALQYHFGSREGLYAALMLKYLRPIDDRRLAILNPRGVKAPRVSLDTCLRALIDPLIEEVGDGDEGLAYMRFLRQFTSRPGFDILDVSRRLNYPGMSLLVSEMHRHLADLPEARRGFAIGLILQVTVTMMATWKLDHPNQFDRDGFVTAAVATCRALLRSLSG